MKQSNVVPRKMYERNMLEAKAVTAQIMLDCIDDAEDKH